MKTCSVTGCEVKQQSKGYCRKHYQRYLKHGDPTITLKRGRTPSPTCSMDGCDRKPVAKSLCTPHYQRLRTHGDPNITLARVKKPRAPKPPTGWWFQGVWPINGPDTKPTDEETRELVELAIGHIPRMAARAGANLEGRARFAVAEGRLYPGSQGAPWVLIARVPATPAAARFYHRAQHQQKVAS